MGDLIYEDDYLKRKLDNLEILNNTTGIDEAAKFNALPSDNDRDLTLKFNNVTGATGVPFIMGTELVDIATASLMFGGIQLQSIEDNAHACKRRFEKKAKGWFPILFTYFDPAISLQIIDAIRDYISDYTKYAKFGTQYGDVELGLMDFIEGTGGIITDIQDYPLNSGSDYTQVILALKTYFYK